MINKLVEEIKKKNAPIVVGLDPMLKLCTAADSKSCFRRIW